MGAVASGGAVVRNETVIRRTGVTAAEFDRAVDAELAVLEQAEQTYRGHRSPLDLTDRTVVVVDDGLATGASARVAVQAVRLHKPARVVVAVRSARRRTCRGSEPTRFAAFMRRPDSAQ